MQERSRSRLLRFAVVMLVAALAVFGWTMRNRLLPAAAGELAPSLTANTLDGRPVSLEEFRGNVVLLNVWATWCPPCVKELPALERLHRKLGPEGLKVVAVSIDAPVAVAGPYSELQAYVDHLKLSFTILHDPKQRAQDLFAPTGLPTTVLIDRSGRIRSTILGAREWDDDEHVREIRALLAEQS